MTAARIPEPREWLLTKRCARCGETKPWAEFSPARYWPDRSVRCVQSDCQKCNTDRARARTAAYRARNLEKIRRYQRDWRRRKMRDLRADRRLNSRLLPVEPFRPWLLQQRERFETWAEFGAVVGVDESVLRRVAKDNRFVSLDVADRCLTRMGFHLDDLYPAGALVRHAARMGKA